jgi:hypothetical protein
MSEGGNLFVPLRDLQMRMEQLERSGETLRPGGPSDTSGGMTEDWKASVNSQLAQLHGDVRNLLYGLIGGFLVLAAAGATAYIKMSDQTTAIQMEQVKATTKLDALDNRVESIDERLGSIDEKLDTLVAARPK